METTKAIRTTTLAAVAFALRFFNMTEEEEAAQIPSPYSYQNIPQAVSVSSRTCLKFGSTSATYTETTERFADGSQFSRSH